MLQSSAVNMPAWPNAQSRNQKSLYRVIGELDHVLASGKDVNILVLDTEGYSNTLVRYMVPPLTRALRDHLMLGYTVQPLPRRLDHGLIELVTALMPVFANRGSSLFDEPFDEFFTPLTAPDATRPSHGV